MISVYGEFKCRWWTCKHKFHTFKKRLRQLPGCIGIHKSWTRLVFNHSTLVTFTSECKQVVNLTSQLVNTSSWLALEQAISSRHAVLPSSIMLCLSAIGVILVMNNRSHFQLGSIYQNKTFVNILSFSLSSYSLFYNIWYLCFNIGPSFFH